ncbi:MAG: FHA domain-containing protein [Acidimicrobiia bacterium]
MPSGVLTVLEYCFLALVYLFLFRVVLTVMSELRPGKIPVSVAAPVAEVAPVAASGDSGRRGGRGSKHWELVIVEPAARAGESFTVVEELTVGRGAGCAVVLTDDTFVSQVHARIFTRGGDVYVEDLGSTNGSLLNGETVVEPVRLRRGDRVQFGQTVMELVR